MVLLVVVVGLAEDWLAVATFFHRVSLQHLLILLARRLLEVLKLMEVLAADHLA